MALLLEAEPPLFEVCKKNKIGTYQVCWCFLMFHYSPSGKYLFKWIVSITWMWNSP
jgi:hypothetical protein